MGSVPQPHARLSAVNESLLDKVGRFNHFDDFFFITFFTIFCSSIRNALTILWNSTRNTSQIGRRRHSKRPKCCCERKSVLAARGARGRQGGTGGAMLAARHAVVRARNLSSARAFCGQQTPKNRPLS